MRKIVDNHKNISKYIASKAKKEESALKKEHRDSLKALQKTHEEKLESKKASLNTSYESKLKDKEAQIISNHELCKKSFFLDAQSKIIDECYSKLKELFDSEMNVELASKIVEKLKLQAASNDEEVLEVRVPKNLKVKDSKAVLENPKIELVTNKRTIYKENFETLLESHKVEVEKIISEELLKNLVLKENV